ncbi:hypothetical protein LCGC14_1950610, partial [marine sediment metagenome]
ILDKSSAFIPIVQETILFTKKYNKMLFLKQLVKAFKWIISVLPIEILFRILFKIEMGYCYITV